jgi:enoyl-CoA hydratase/carnithine racemase
LRVGAIAVLIPLEAHPASGHIATSGAGWIMSTFEHIIVENIGAVGIITLNRPKMLNALSFGVFREIAAAVDDLEADDKIGCILLAGGEKAFAAGADIKEMQPKTFIASPTAANPR